MILWGDELLSSYSVGLRIMVKRTMRRDSRTGLGMQGVQDSWSARSPLGLTNLDFTQIYLPNQLLPTGQKETPIPLDALTDQPYCFSGNVQSLGCMQGKKSGARMPGRNELEIHWQDEDTGGISW